MTPEQFRKALTRIGLTIAGFARWLPTTERTARRWASEGDIPAAVAKLLRLMIRLRLKPSDVK